MEKGEGVKYAKIYQIGGYPTLLFLDKDATMVHSDAGFKDATMFLNLCQEALDPARRLSGLDEKFNKGEMEPHQLLSYIQKRAILMNASHDKATDAFLKYAPDWKQDTTMEFIMNYIGNPGSLGFLFLLDNRKNFNSRYGAAIVTRKIENVIYEELTKGTHRAGIDLMEKVLKQVYPESSDRMIAKYKMTYFASMFDGASFILAAENYISLFPPEDPAEWADISFQLADISKNKSDLKKAMGWVEEALKKEETFECHLAIAFLYKAMDKNKKAKNAAQKAITWAKDNGESYLPAEQFISTLQ
jgi:tetratricopeptide (TPR) repeat protein